MSTDSVDYLLLPIAAIRTDMGAGQCPTMWTYQRAPRAWLGNDRGAGFAVAKGLKKLHISDCELAHQVSMLQSSSLRDWLERHRLLPS